jgi:ribonuclease HII
MTDEKTARHLKELGIKDSKMLSPEQREKLFDKILETTKHKIVIIDTEAIDNSVALNRLNYLEADRSADMIRALKPDIAYIDCPSTNIAAYKKYLESKVNDKTIKIVAEHKADSKYVVVSAASILAKVTRDREIEKLKRIHKVNFGSGYPSDPLTQDFLKKNYKRFDFFRKSWQSYKDVAQKEKQRGLGDF